MGSKQPKIVIHIASLEALEQIIGKEPEGHLNVCSAIVQNFANKHLKAIAEGFQVPGSLKDGLEECVRFAIADELRHAGLLISESNTQPWGKLRTVISMTADAQQLIEGQVQKWMETILKESVNRAVEKIICSAGSLNERIDRRIERITEEEITRRIQMGVQEKVQQMIKVVG